MNDRSEMDDLLVAWFIDGPTVMPEGVVGDVSRRIAGQPQRFSREPRGRLGDSRSRLRLIFALAAAIALLSAGLSAAGRYLARDQRALPGPSASAFAPSSAFAPAPPSSGLIVYEQVGLTVANHLRYVQANGVGVPLLPDFGGHQRTAIWRPDGEKLAFAGYPKRRTDDWMRLYETDANGSTPRLLSTDCRAPACVEETDPAYSPDGKRLVAVRLADLTGGKPTRSVLVIYDLSTGKATEIPQTSYPYATRDIGHPRWSPDGRQIVFHVVHDPPTERRDLVFPESTSPGESNLFIVDADGSNLHQLTPDGLPAGDPDWSPDGSRIVFGTDPLHLWLYGQAEDTRWTIHTIRPDGTDLRPLEPDPHGSTPSWASGGTKLLFAQDSGGDATRFLLSAPDGSDAKVVAGFSTKDALIYPVMQPTLGSATPN